MKNSRKIGLRSKLSIAVIMCMLIPMLVTVSSAYWYFTNMMEESEQKSFEQDIVSAQKVIDDSMQNSTVIAEIVSSSPELINGLASNNRQMVLESLKEMYTEINEKLKFDAFYVIGNDLKTFARLHNPAKFGDDKSKVDVFVQTLKTGEVKKDWAVGVTASEFLGVAPVKKDGQVIGMVGIGQHINEDLLKSIAQAVSSDVTLYEKNIVMATTEGHLKKGIELTDEIIKAALAKGEMIKLFDHEFVEGEVEELVDLAFIPIQDANGQLIGAVKLEKNQMALEKKENLILLVMIFFSLILTVLAVYVGGWLGKRIAQPIVEIAEVGNLIAQGNLNVPEIKVQTDDEIGSLASSFNTMTVNLRESITEISSSAVRLAESANNMLAFTQEAAQVTGGVKQTMDQLIDSNRTQGQQVEDVVMIVEQLSLAIEQIASGAQEQARNVNEGNVRVTEMARNVGEVALNTQKVAESSSRAATVAQEGSQVVQDTIKGMEKIRTTVHEAGNTIRQMGDQSQKIGEIIEVIDDIAGQTNLLALNAAIEAARAGEHGKGFAVVADEVRKLAERSSLATKQIGQLITVMQSGTAQAVHAMESGVREVEVGADLAQRAGIALNEILDTVNQANLQAQNIARSIDQIAHSSEQVVQTIDNVAAITEENTAATEEMSAGSNSVRDSIVGIKNQVHKTIDDASRAGEGTDQVHAWAQEMYTMFGMLSSLAQDLSKVVGKFKV